VSNLVLSQSRQPAETIVLQKKAAIISIIRTNQ